MKIFDELNLVSILYIVQLYIYIFNQESKGIRQWLMCIPNDDTQNYPFCRLKLVVESIGQTIRLVYQINFLFGLFLYLNILKNFFPLPDYYLDKRVAAKWGVNYKDMTPAYKNFSPQNL